TFRAYACFGLIKMSLFGFPVKDLPGLGVKINLNPGPICKSGFLDFIICSQYSVIKHFTVSSLLLKIGYDPAPFYELFRLFLGFCMKRSVCIGISPLPDQVWRSSV